MGFNPNTTEAILFSLNATERIPNWIFDNTIIQFVENHKHLGVTLNYKGQWHAHIDNILQSASKVVGLMRKRKFILNRKSLNQIYLSYIAPIMEYADSLQKLQNEAARIVI